MNRLFGKRIADINSNRGSTRGSSNRGSSNRGSNRRTVRANSSIGKEFALLKNFILSNAEKKQKRNLYNKLFKTKDLILDHSKLEENIRKLNKSEIDKLIELTENTIKLHTFTRAEIINILKEKNDAILGNANNSATFEFVDLINKHKKLERILKILNKYKYKTATPRPSS
jgi:hypothetical protein